MLDYAKYYVAKLNYMAPKEGTDEMKNETKSYLVKAMSVIEVETKLINWVPSNFQDAKVTSVQESKLVDLIIEEDTETFWEAKLGDENDKGKLVPFLVAIDGVDHFDVLRRLEKKYSTSQFIALKKMNVLVEEDLIAEGVVTNNTKEEVEEEDFKDAPF